MSTGNDPGPIHASVTARSGYRYCFYRKHHDPRNAAEAQWSADVGREEEFEIFNTADRLEVSDANGNLFGMRNRRSEKVLPLGTKGEQIAKYPSVPRGESTPWHGYPLGPLVAKTPGRPAKSDIPKAALDRFVAEKLINDHERRRLSKGKQI